ncbi:MAG: hypothetical protein KGS72_07490 [Cyanobacteria bacterium REEB67]|nr:hypothetical protein [Cyanobacteria bacterium REEB67]
MAGIKLVPFFIAALAALSADLSFAQSAAAAKSATETLKFHGRISIGRLYEMNPAQDPIATSDPRGKFLGAACGEVQIPVGTKVFLDLDPVAVENPDCLEDIPNKLYGLRARYTDATDAVLLRICKLSELRRLDMVECEVTDSGAMAIEKLKKLERFALATANVNGAYFKVLPTLPNLRCLGVSNNKLTAENVATLSLATSLETINLTGSHITDQGLKHLATLKNLRGLDLNSNPEVTIAGLLPLKACKKLEYLNFRHTALRANDLLRLKGLPLKRVEMNETVLSGPIETAVRNAFPICNLELGKRVPSDENKMLFAPMSR